MLKKCLSVILVLALAVAFVPLLAVGSFAANWGFVLNYEKINNGAEVEITGCFYNASGGVTIPSEIDGLPVTSIASDAFKNRTSITSVSIPDSVTSIGGDAFRNCSSLASVTIGNGVTDIGAGAFLHCDSLSSVAIPGSVTNIGENAFGFYPSGFGVKKVDDFIIYCPIGSAGEAYAAKNGFESSAFKLDPKSELKIKSGRLISKKGGITADALLSQLSTFTGTIAIYKNGAPFKGKGFVGTGCIIKIMDGETEYCPPLTMIIKGDVNGDGKVKIPDAQKVLRVASGLENFDGNPAAEYAADVDGEAGVKVPDARKILRVAVGLEGF